MAKKIKIVCMGKLTKKLFRVAIVKMYILLGQF